MTKRINMRLAEGDLERIKTRAEEEGVSVTAYMVAGALGRKMRGPSPASVALIDEALAIVRKAHGALWPEPRPDVVTECLEALEELHHRAVQ